MYKGEIILILEKIKYNQYPPVYISSFLNVNLEKVID